MGTGSEERPQWLVYYRTENKTRGRVVISSSSACFRCLFDFLASLFDGFSEKSMLELGAEIEEEGKARIVPSEMAQGEVGTVGVVLQRWGDVMA